MPGADWRPSTGEGHHSCGVTQWCELFDTSMSEQTPLRVAVVAFATSLPILVLMASCGVGGAPNRLSRLMVKAGMVGMISASPAPARPVLTTRLLICSEHMSWTMMAWMLSSLPPRSVRKSVRKPVLDSSRVVSRCKLGANYGTHMSSPEATRCIQKPISCCIGLQETSKVKLASVHGESMPLGIALVPEALTE